MAARPTHESHDARPIWQPIGVILLVALVASVAGISNEFAQDDIYLILQNANAHSVANLGAIFRSPFWPAPFNPDLYRPLTSLWLAAQYQLGGGAPIVFRLVSYAMYAGVAVNVYLLARRFVPDAYALGAALLFAAHPVHVEAVALGVGQSELAVALIALIMVQRYLVRRAAGRLGLRDWIGLSLWYAVASLFKEQGLMLPGLLIAAEWLLVDDREEGRIKSVVPGYVALAIVGTLVLAARRAVLGDVAGTFVAEALVGVPFTGRLLTLLRVAVAWIRLFAWPAHLQADYGAQEVVASTSFGPIELAGMAILLAITVSAWLMRRKCRAYAFGVVWCAIALFPVSNLLVPTAIVLAERTLFLPSVGFVLAVGGLLSLAAERFPQLVRPRGLAIACAILVVAGVARSIERQRVWRDDAFLAVRTVQDAPLSFRAQRIFGDVAFDLQRMEIATTAYDEALNLAPPAQRWRVRNDIARTYRRAGQTKIEAEHLRASLADRPEQQDTRGYLISAELSLGNYNDAARQADTALVHGGDPAIFKGLRQVADSAAKINAPAGSVRVRLTTGLVRRAQ